MDTEKVEQSKKEVAKTKNGALWLGMIEICEYINPDELGAQIFGQSKKWFKQRVQHISETEPQDFCEEEYAKMVTVFRELSAKFAMMADNIEAGVM